MAALREQRKMQKKHGAERSVDLTAKAKMLESKAADLYKEERPEVVKLAERMVKWLKVGGHIFFRESCFRQSGDHKGKSNPTQYREPGYYFKVFNECIAKDDSGDSYELILVSSKCIGAYVKHRKSKNEICWLWQKVRSEDYRGFQQLSDNVQYKK